MKYFQNKVHLGADELTAVRKNLQTQGIEVDAEYVGASISILGWGKNQMSTILKCFLFKG